MVERKSGVQYFLEEDTENTEGMAILVT